MASAHTFSGSVGLLQAKPLARRNAAHALAVVLVWVTVVSSAVVMIEPAPVDALTIGLMLLLPVMGLAAFPPVLSGGFALWLIIGAFGLLSSTFARDVPAATQHMVVSIYLFGACFIFAAFVARNPERHTKLIFSAYLMASLIAAILALIGYFDLIPGSYQSFTFNDRAVATFKDPNVFAPFLILGLLIALHQWLVRSVAGGLLPLVGAAVIMLGILFSFSRGAWAVTVFAIALHGYLYAITAERTLQRLKIAALVLLATAIVGLTLAAALQSDSVSRLLEDRAALMQTYDAGTEGRFGGQLKAIDVLIDHPLGIGSQNFSGQYHHEEVHNVYLSMILNAGWVGGLLYAIICVGTLALGFSHALRRTKTQPLFMIAYAALAANIIVGLVIDTDHWRHFYLLMGIVWGLMAADRRVLRKARIVCDSRSPLHHRVLLIPQSRRGRRIVGRVPPRLTTWRADNDARPARHQLPAQKHARRHEPNDDQPVPGQPALRRGQHRQGRIVVR